jgi:predicted transcriptional regulator
MKSVLISIQPKWCELIASGKKTIEVRKTKPKLETPFKCYIYCTKGNDGKYFWTEQVFEGKLGKYAIPYVGNGKVIGEFVCDSIEIFRFDALEMTYVARKYRDTKLLNEEFFKGTQVTYQEAYDYCEGMTFDEEDTDYFYGWHISDLVIYDKPRELGEFYVWKKCNSCRDTGYESTACCYDEDCKVPAVITRPPQSWCYVESEEGK